MLITKMHLNGSLVIFSLSNYRKVSLASFLLFASGGVLSLTIITLREAHLRMVDESSFSNYIAI
jgi:hypothetical protein